MKHNSALAPYETQYRDIQFDRAGLFALIRKQFKVTELLYPGSSVHITPSFYFPHVVYVDTSKTAVRFFAEETAVLAYINRHKTYKRSAYLQFIAQDYTKPLPLPENQFDLLLALFAPHVIQTCQKYLKRGGVLITNNFQDEALTAAAMPQFQPIALVQYRQKAYRLVTEKPEAWLKPARKTKVKRYLEQAAAGFAYVEEEDYFFFQKRRFHNA